MLLLIYFYIIGTIIGSFLNVVILRLPKDLSLLGRSFCPHCKIELPAYTLVPVLSFVFLRGKCKNCQAKISWRYASIEFLTGCAFAFCFYFFQPETVIEYVYFVRALLALSLFIVIFVIDLENFLILDSVLLFGSIFTFVFNILIDFNQHLLLSWQNGLFLSGIVGALAAGILFWALWYFSQGRALGFGDVKFALVLGLIFGWPLVLVNIFLAIMLGGIVSVWLLTFGGKNLKSQVPFGAFLTVSGFVVLFWGKAILTWYLGYLGL